MKTLFLALLLFQAAVPARTGSGIVTGTVLSTDGTPAAGVRVAAVPVPESNQTAGTPVPSSIGQTDIAGSYRLENIPPGPLEAATLFDLPTTGSIRSQTPMRSPQAPALSRSGPTQG